MGRVSDYTLKQRVRGGWISLLFILPLTFAVSYYGWQSVEEYFFSVPPSQMIQYTPFLSSFVLSVFVFLPLYITGVWYVTLRREFPAVIHAVFVKIFVSLFVCWFLVSIPFHIWATDYLEKNKYIYCSDRETARGISVYVLDEALCVKR